MFIYTLTFVPISSCMLLYWYHCFLHPCHCHSPMLMFLISHQDLKFRCVLFRGSLRPRLITALLLVLCIYCTCLYVNEDGFFLFSIRTSRLSITAKSSLTQHNALVVECTTIRSSLRSHNSFVGGCMRVTSYYKFVLIQSSLSMQ